MIKETPEPPIAWQRMAIAAAIALLLLPTPTPVSADTGTIRVSYYGLGDGYLGHRHAASHWGQTPDNWPEVVDPVHYGIATTDWSIPFGTELCFRVVRFPAWAENEYIDLVGTMVCGIVVDRMPAWVKRQYGTSVDVWPALALALFGKDFERIGTVTARIVQKGSGGRRELAERTNGDIR